MNIKRICSRISFLINASFFLVESTLWAAAQATVPVVPPAATPPAAAPAAPVVTAAAATPAPGPVDTSAIPPFEQPATPAAANPAKPDPTPPASPPPATAASTDTPPPPVPATSSAATASATPAPIYTPTTPPPVKTSVSAIPVNPSTQTFQQIMETPTNPWLDETTSLDAKARLDRMRASSPTSAAEMTMQSLYPAWKEAIDKYPPWVEAFATYPVWKPTSYNTGYPAWNLVTTDTQGLALALAESKYNVGNIDAFNKYIRTIETSNILPGTTFVRKGDISGVSSFPTSGAAAVGASSSSSAVESMTDNINPLVASYLLLQNGVDLWETVDPLGKLKAMCCIMSSKAQVTIAKAQALGYPANIIAQAQPVAHQAFLNAKEATASADPNRLSALYEMIVTATMTTVKTIGLSTYTPSKTPTDPRIASMITDADSKISYVIAIISQGTSGTNQSQQVASLRSVIQQMQSTQTSLPTASSPTPEASSAPATTQPAASPSLPPVPPPEAVTQSVIAPPPVNTAPIKP